ncbi:MAG TPA: efflux RND transporter permease subunit, partial [Tepidisphaeraceae bacterium]
NPSLLNSFGLGMADVKTALSNANANRPKGDVETANHTYALATTDQLFKAREYRPLLVAYRHGAPVRLSDVATVSDSIEDVRTVGLYDTQPAILMIVFRQPGANIIDTVDRVRALVPQFQAEIPADIKMSVVMDRTTTIRASVHDVQITLLVSICLVIVVVFLFLRSPRTTFIPTVAVPVSLVGTFGVMYLFGYSIDNLSLMALAIATGFVVDDAIVVIENIARHLEAGMRPFEAALLGAKEIGFTVVSISVSLVAVFIPILLMSGIVGRLFREFAVTLSVAIGISMVVSLTTTPMLCALLLKPHDQERHGRLYRASERVFDWILGAYELTLGWVMRHSALMLVATILTVIFTVLLYFIVPSGFFPQQDTGRMMGQVIADQDVSAQAMAHILAQYAEIVSSDPAVDNVVAFAGSNAGAINSARMFIALKPLEQRQGTIDQIRTRLTKAAARVPGALLVFQAVQDLRIGGHSTASQYQYTLQGDNLADLSHFAPLLLEKIRKLPGIVDVVSDQQNRGLAATLVYDRATAARLGINPQTIDSTLYSSFGQSQVSTMYEQLNQYHVVMEVDPQFWQSPDGLQHIYVPGRNGAQVPLSAFTHYAPSTTPLAVNHSGQFPSATISFNLAPGVSLGAAVSEIEQAERDLGVPASLHGSFAGTAQAFQDLKLSEILLVIAALVAVYIVLGVLYESYIHPITILSTLPSAGVGALLAMLVFNVELSLISLIGIILLIGIVKKNAIMMIDFALLIERQEHKPPEQAIFKACMLRFRPITMTTMAALFGGLPLALGTGNGAELRRPLGIAIVGGLIFSQMLTLYTTPVIYLYLDRLRLWFERLRGHRPTPVLPAPASPGV